MVDCEICITNGTKQPSRAGSLPGTLLLRETAIAVLGKESGADDIVNNLEKFFAIAAFRACYQAKKGRLLRQAHKRLLSVVAY